jgi:hypothetical protein
VKQDDDTEAVSRPAAATHVVEAAVAVLAIVLGVVVIVESRRLGAGWTTDGPGSGYFPFYIGLIIVLSAGGMLVQALFGRKRKTGPFVDTAQLKRVMSVLAPAVIYVIAIMALGVYVASAVYIALFMVILGHYHWAKAAAAALVIVTLLFLMFETWFKVPLYPGALDPLGWLMYGP